MGRSRVEPLDYSARVFPVVWLTVDRAAPPQPSESPTWLLLPLGRRSSRNNIIAAEPRMQNPRMKAVIATTVTKDPIAIGSQQNGVIHTSKRQID